MSYITTYTGKRFDITAPDASLIDIEDIAHALSLTCRGNGHVRSFYSVAQHCIACCREAIGRNYSDKVALACLIHDAAECYLSDVPRPLKASVPEYVKTEETLQDMIYEKFLGEKLTEEERALVKEVDDAALFYDLTVLLGETPEGPVPYMHMILDYFEKPFKDVEEEFLDLFDEFF